MENARTDEGAEKGASIWWGIGGAVYGLGMTYLLLEVVLPWFQSFGGAG